MEIAFTMSMVWVCVTVTTPIPRLKARPSYGDECWNQPLSQYPVISVWNSQCSTRISAGADVGRGSLK